MEWSTENRNVRGPVNTRRPSAPLGTGVAEEGLLASRSRFFRQTCPKHQSAFPPAFLSGATRRGLRRTSSERAPRHITWGRGYPLSPPTACDASYSSWSATTRPSSRPLRGSRTVIKPFFTEART